MAATGGTAKRMTSKALGEAHEYAHGEERPLRSFLVIMGAYGAVAAGMAGFWSPVRSASVSGSLPRACSG